MKAMFAASLLLLAAPAQAGTPTWDAIRAAGWTHHATREHEAAGTVQVYTKAVAGVDCFQGVASTQYTPEQLMDVAADIEGTIQWSTAGVSEARTLARSDTQMDYFQYLDVPGWTMASDRFWILRGHFQRHDGVVTLHWDRFENEGPYAALYQRVRADHPSAIEPPVNVGGWVYSPVDGATRIQYYICSDVGGVVPTSVQNVGTNRTLPDTVGDVVREAGRRAGK